MATGAWIEDVGGSFGGFADNPSTPEARAGLVGGPRRVSDEDQGRHVSVLGARFPFRISLGDAPFVDVGRAAVCGLCAPRAPTARLHARFAFVDGGWTISDLGSSGGTYVDDRRVSGASRLSDGARVFLNAQTRFTFRHGEVDDVAGAGCSVGGRYLFARTWPHARHFQSVVVDGNTVAIRAASFVPRDRGRVFAATRSILADDGERTMLVESADADGPTLLHIANATKAAGASIDEEVLGAVAAMLPAYANDLHEVVVTWSGEVAVLGVPELRTQMQHRDWFALRLRELGYGVAHWHSRTPRESSSDRALLAGFVQRLFPEEAKRAQERRDQILMRAAEEWRTAITRWRL